MFNRPPLPRFKNPGNDFSSQRDRLDIGIINGRLSKYVIKDLQNSFGQNKLFYRVFKEKDHFESEKIALSIEKPHWKEIFAFPLNKEDEVITFEIYKSNLSEGGQLLDKFIVKLEDVLLKFVDQHFHQITCFTEKESVFEVAMRWRHDDSKKKIQQLRQKLLKMKKMLQEKKQASKLTKEETEQLKKLEENQELKETWGGENQNEDGNLKRQEPKQKRKAIGKLSKSGSRSRKNKEDHSDNSSQGAWSEYQLHKVSKPVNFTTLTQVSHNNPYYKPYTETITPKSYGQQVPPRIVSHNIKVTDKFTLNDTNSNQASYQSPKSPFLEQQQQLLITNKSQKNKIKVNSSSRQKNRDSPNSLFNFKNDHGSPLTHQNVGPGERRGSGVISHFKKNSAQAKQMHQNIESSPGRDSQNSIPIISEEANEGSPFKIYKPESYKIKNNMTAKEFQNQNPASISQKNSSNKLLGQKQKDNQSIEEEPEENVQQVSDLQSMVSSGKGSKVVSMKQSEIHQQIQNDEDRKYQNQEEQKVTATKVFKIKPKYNQQMKQRSDLMIEVPDESPSVNVTGEVQFEESRQQSQINQTFSEHRPSEKNMTFRKESVKLPLEVTSSKQLNMTMSQEQTPKLFNEMPKNYQNDQLNTEDKYKEWYDEIQQVMHEAAEQKKVKQQNSTKNANAPQQKISQHNLLSPQSSYLGSQNQFRQTPRKITDTSLMLCNSMKDKNDFINQTCFTQQNYFPMDQSQLSNDKEILLPTQENLKRIELKNQRRDLTNSLASSTINQIIKNPGKARSVFAGNNNENPLYPKPSGSRQQQKFTPNFKFGMGPTSMAMQFNHRFTMQGSFGMQSFQPKFTYGDDQRQDSIAAHGSPQVPNERLSNSQLSCRSGLGMGLFFKQLGGMGSISSLQGKQEQ